MDATAEAPRTAPDTRPQGRAPRRVDALVVGAGIVGLATARALLRARPGMQLAVLERADGPAAHQSGHNSGVIHSGLYYRPGSLKAQLCTAGRTELEQWCTDAGIPFERCGKVVVATSPEEVPALEALAERGRRNGLVVDRVGPQGLMELEPHATGVAALHVRATGVVDYRLVCARLAEEVVELGGTLHFGTGVDSVAETSTGLAVRTDAGLWWAGRVVTCAGAWSDRLARRSGARPSVRILPFRGEYHELRPEAAHLVRHLVYPVPDPRFPFLGVHFTRGIDGTVHAGPNAVPALGRDSYRWSTVRPAEVAAFVARPSTWRLARRYWRTGAAEIARSLRRHEAVRAMQRLVPEITDADLLRGGSGVRAQAISRDGTLVDDFAIVREGRCLHVLNAPSPAATASLAIGAWIAEAVLEPGSATLDPAG